VLQAIATGQTQTSGTAVAPKAIEAAPFVVRVRLDDAEVAHNLPAGTEGVYNTPLASGFITGEAIVLLVLAAASFK